MFLPDIHLHLLQFLLHTVDLATGAGAGAGAGGVVGVVVAGMGGAGMVAGVGEGVQGEGAQGELVVEEVKDALGALALLVRKAAAGTGQQEFRILPCRPCHPSELSTTMALSRAEQAQVVTAAIAIIRSPRLLHHPRCHPRPRAVHHVTVRAARARFRPPAIAAVTANDTALTLLKIKL